jgi:hypothetical protein
MRSSSSYEARSLTVNGLVIAVKLPELKESLLEISTYGKSSGRCLNEYNSCPKH